MHPTVVATPEMPLYLFFRNTYRNDKAIGKRGAEQMKRYVDLLLQRTPEEGQYFRSRVQDDEWMPRTDDTLKSFHLRLQTSLLNPEHKTDIRNIVLKHPIHTLFAHELSKDFPEARFIHIVRDPRDNVLSRMNNPNRKSTNPYLSTRLWNKYNTIASGFGLRSPEKYLLVRYEDLICEPTLTIRTICDFIGIEFKQEMLNPERSSYFGDLSTTDFAGSNAEYSKERYLSLITPFDCSKAFKWKKGGNPEVLALCEKLCADQMLKYNYERSGTHPLSLKKLVLSRIKVSLMIFKLKLIQPMPINLKLSRLEKRVKYLTGGEG